jgi:hypothetical protein
MANLAVNPGMHAYSERADDLYETPPAAVLALLATVSLPHRVWEPAAGRGAIVEVLRSAGHDVVASDIRDHGAHRCAGITTGVDFFKTVIAPDGVAAILILAGSAAFVRVRLIESGWMWTVSNW